jgi:Uri superfamily endonuclease
MEYWMIKAADDFPKNIIMPPITILGREQFGGAYLLRIRVPESLRLRFGKFKQGKLIHVKAGDYLYIGSATGSRGSTRLASRILRHTSRTHPKPAHILRPKILEHLQTIGMRGSNLLPKRDKRLHWHIDYLLDEKSVEITHVLLIHHQQRLELKLGKWLQDRPETIVFEPGLGAGDAPGNTHLLYVEADESWWLEVLKTLEKF